MHRTRGRSPSSSERDHQKDDRTLFVGNVPVGMLERELKDIFHRYGEIVDIRHPIDPRTGDRKKFAFVEFTSTRVVDELCNRGNVRTDHGLVLDLGRSVRPRGDGGRGPPPGRSTDQSFSSELREEQRSDVRPPRASEDQRMEVDERRERKRERTYEVGNSRSRDKIGDRDRERDSGRVVDRVVDRVPYAGRRETGQQDRTTERAYDRPPDRSSERTSDRLYDHGIRSEEDRRRKERSVEGNGMEREGTSLPPPRAPAPAPAPAPGREEKDGREDSRKEKEKEKEENRSQGVLGEKKFWEDGMLEHLLHMENMRSQRDEEWRKARKRM
eukprot:TRINITY_DN680_c1_g4_i1.p1 TRINITY_DN680_c1_g4~~TRINITY_DN680_c1_g4_i1.p1  ORF type:complete len:328 (-),score=116.62 TRINITY_DN680_c1_g4_i1:82-1065(-)